MCAMFLFDFVFHALFFSLYFAPCAHSSFPLTFRFAYFEAIFEVWVNITDGRIEMLNNIFGDNFVEFYFLYCLDCYFMHFGTYMCSFHCQHETSLSVVS